MVVGKILDPASLSVRSTKLLPFSVGCYRAKSRSGGFNVLRQCTHYSGSSALDGGAWVQESSAFRPSSNTWTATANTRVECSILGKTRGLSSARAECASTVRWVSLWSDFAQSAQFTQAELLSLLVILRSLYESPEARGRGVIARRTRTFSITWRCTPPISTKG